MGLRQHPRPLTGLLILVILSGCATTGTTPQPSPQAIANPPPADELWSGPKAPKRTSTVPAVPVVSSPPPAPALASQTTSTLAGAVEQARSSYERGLQAMRSGDQDQAEWEFDLALETLLSQHLAAKGPTPLRAITRPPVMPPPPDWISSLHLPQRLPILAQPSNVVPPPSVVEPPPSVVEPPPSVVEPPPSVVEPPPSLALPHPPHVVPPPGLPADEEAPVEAPALLTPEPPADEEAPLEAPALLTPEDLDEMEGEREEDTTALPEPDVQKHDIAVVFNDQVRAFVHHFQARKWGVITRAFERASRYLPMMRRVFEEEALPLDLINLAFIESAVNPWATSRAKAAGIWQFMPATGRLYGMHMSWWLDERRDPEKSTRGAAKYLKKLYEMFEDWPLALAAYNVGEGAIQNATRRQNTRNFWALRLPKETKLFVPAFMAMTIISREPDRYGFSPPPDAPVEVETVTLPHPVDLKVLAQAAGTTPEEIRSLNPALIRWATPPDRPFALRIPSGRSEGFREAIERIPPDQRITWIRHTVRKGETPSLIARRYGVDVQSVLDLNGLRKRQPLKTGSALRIPPVPTPAYLVQPEGKRSSRTPAAPGRRPAQHTVKRGETLDRIARTHGISPGSLRQWNNLSRSTALRPGQKLVVSAPKPGREAGTPGQSSPARLEPAKAGPAPKTYVVKPGDTLAGIARTHAVSPDELRRWNRLSPTETIQPGKELRVERPAS